MFRPTRYIWATSYRIGWATFIESAMLIIILAHVYNGLITP